MSKGYIYRYKGNEGKAFHFCLSLQAIYISRITEGGAAAKDGKLLVGDRVISVSISFLHVLRDLYVHFLHLC